MERAGSGFHGYRKISNISPGKGLNGMKLSDQMNQLNTTDDNDCIVREQDRFMPIANVIRIMRKILPPHAKISDDAKETIQECVSEYISFVTGEANERCQREQRKTITAEDVLWAMNKLGFDDYMEPLTVYLHRYREMDGERGSMRGDPILLMKRAIEYGNPSPTHQGIDAAAFGPHHVFQFGHHSHGYFRYLKEASTSQASPVANGNGDAHATPFKCNGNEG